MTSLFKKWLSTVVAIGIAFLPQTLKAETLEIDQEQLQSYFETYYFPGNNLELPEDIENFKSGVYDLNSNYTSEYAPSGVKSRLYIPKGIAEGEPAALIKFYHGSTRDENAYQNISNLMQWADQYGFIVLSVQNIWILDWENRDTIQGIWDSIQGGLNVEQTLIKYGVVDEDQVFTSGFSAGGLVAQCEFLRDAEKLGGLGNMNGNFYGFEAGYFADEFEMKTLAYDSISFEEFYEKGFTFFSFAGENDAERVQTQLPEALDFFNHRGIPVQLVESPWEGHAFTSKNMEDFWDKVIMPARERDWATTNPSENFERDAKNSPYQKAILNARERDLAEGYSDGTFRPLRSINRAEFTKIILNAIGKEPQGSHCFLDVKEEWFAEYVCAAKTIGIINGYPDETFKPQDNINVAEALKIVLNAFSIEVNDPEDDEKWYTPYVDVAKENGWYLETFLSEIDRTSREDMVELIERISPLEMD